MKKKIVNSLLLGIALSSIALYFAFRNVPFNDLVAYLGSINYFWIIPSAGVGLATFVLRVIRWQLILESSRRLNFWRAFHPLMIGFMINSVLPGRVGEFARPAILKKKDHIPFSTGFATVVAERAFDMSLLIVLFFVVLSYVNIDPDFNLAYGDYHLSRETLEMVARAMVRFSILIVLGIIVVSVGRTRKIIQGVIHTIPNWFYHTSASFQDRVRTKISKPLIRMTENVASGFALVKSLRKILICLGLSLVIWFLTVLAFYLMTFGSPGINLSFFEMAAVLIIICFFIALPSVPGYWGIWEAGGVFALSLFSITGKEAAGYTLVNHAVQMFPVIIVGLISAVLTGINILQISYSENK